MESGGRCFVVFAGWQLPFGLSGVSWRRNVEELWLRALGDLVAAPSPLAPTSSPRAPAFPDTVVLKLIPQSCLLAWLASPNVVSAGVVALRLFVLLLRCGYTDDFLQLHLADWLRGLSGVSWRSLVSSSRSSMFECTLKRWLSDNIPARIDIFLIVPCDVCVYISVGALLQYHCVQWHPRLLRAHFSGGSLPLR